MIVHKCDLCERTSDKPADILHGQRWRKLELRRKKNWMAALVPVVGNMFREAEDSWPGHSRWFSDPVIVHLCSEDCMFRALARLHEGALVVGIEGFAIPADALLAMVREGQVAA